VLSAYHSEERKVQALYILVVGINPPKPPLKTVPYRLPHHGRQHSTKGKT